MCSYPGPDPCPICTSYMPGHKLRAAIRNYLLPMTKIEMRRELDLSVVRNDFTRAKYVLEFIQECQEKGEFDE